MNMQTRVRVPDHLRPEAVYIAGNPGSGKSSLIQALVLQDLHIRAQPKRGVCVIDPTGDLIPKLLHWIPEDRVADTIYFDSDHPIPIDFFSYRNPAERGVLTDQLLDIFHLDNAPVSKPRLMKILGTLFDANENPKMREDDRATFLDIQHFIEDRSRRETILSYCPHRRPMWPEALFSKPAEFSSIIERMAPFTESPTLRVMLQAKRPELNISNVMQDNNILLVSLKDTPTDAFLGALIASKFQQATFARRDIRLEEERIPYYLYIDECNTILRYGAEQFETILVRARKYRLCLTLSNQIPEDLPEGIRKKLGTIGSLVLFNLDTNNARLFKDKIAPYKIEDLVNLPKFAAILRTNNKVHLIDTPLPLGPSPASYAEIIRKRTVERAACNTATRISHDGGRDDEIKPTGSPQYQAHKGKKKDT
jgi:hypothetical protein